MENLPNIGDPVAAELVSLNVGGWVGEEGLTIRIRLEDGRELEVQLPPDAPEVPELLEVVGRLATSALSPLGQKGVVVTAIAPPLEIEDGDV